MKALIFQTMLALLIPGLTDTPKALLTPPSAYDFSVVYSPTVDDNDWTYGSPSFRYPLDLNKLGGNTWSYTGFTWNNTIYSLENAYTVASVRLIGKTGDISALSEENAFWSSNYLYGSTPPLTIYVDNYSKFPIVMSIDISSSTIIKNAYIKINNVDVGSEAIIYRSGLSRVYIPSFSKLNFEIYNSNTYLDALYFDVVSPTDAYQDYEDYIIDETFNSGYNDGYTTAIDEFGNFDWLSSLFTTMGDLLAIEILPGITIGLILLIPIVFGVLRFIMGLFR